MAKNKCVYRFETGKSCERLVDDKDRYCIFHKVGVRSVENQRRFWWRLKRLTMKGDGDWRGFHFPRINFERVNCPIFITATRAQFESVMLKQSNFEKGVDISNSQVKGEFAIQSGVFGENLSFKGICFPSDFSILSTNVEKGVVGHNCSFMKSFKVSGSFMETANFGQCHFADKAEFLQSKTITISTGPISFQVSGGAIGMVVSKNNADKGWKQKLKWKFIDVKRATRAKLLALKNKLVAYVKKWWKAFMQTTKNKFNYYRQKFPHERQGVTKFFLFDKKASLDNMTFGDSSKVLFKGVNLQNATFSGTDLRGVTFIGNNWYQPKLKRNGLKDEIRYLNEINNYYDKKECLPNLESTYRNIRFSLEENKDFGQANDFFVGEMEAKRRQLPFLKRHFLSVLAVYKLISNYGTSPIRVGLLFLAMVLTHMVLISDATGLEFSISANLPTIQSINWFAPIESSRQAWSTFSLEVNSIGLRDSLTYSLQTMTLQKEKVLVFKPENIVGTSVPFINSVFTVIGPVVIALFALTVRTRIKRN